MGQNKEQDSDEAKTCSQDHGVRSSVLPLQVASKLVPMPFPLTQGQANHGNYSLYNFSNDP